MFSFCQVTTNTLLSTGTDREVMAAAKKRGKGVIRVTLCHLVCYFWAAKRGISGAGYIYLIYKRESLR